MNREVEASDRVGEYVIMGHEPDDDEARRAVAGYLGEPPEDLIVTNRVLAYRRFVPCAVVDCDCDGRGHWWPASRGRGAAAITYVEVRHA